MCVRIKVGNPHMKYFWFGAFLVFLVLLGVYSWYAIEPVDLHTRIEHYILAPLPRELSCSCRVAGVHKDRCMSGEHPGGR